MRLTEAFNYHSLESLPKSLDFEVEPAPIFDMEGNIISGFKSIVRTDNGQVLHVGGRQYKPLQNSEFEDLANRFAEIAGNRLLGFETLKGGKQVNAYITSGDSFRVGEQVNNFTILTNTHDGSSPFTGGIGEFIPRCSNGISVYAQQYSARIKHNHEITQRAALLPLYFESVEKQRQSFYEYCEQLAYVRMNERQKQEALAQLFNITQSRELLPVRTQNRLAEVEHSLAREMNHYGNTAYGFLQGITHYTSNVLKTRERQLIPTTNTAADLNKSAFNYLTQNFLNN